MAKLQVTYDFNSGQQGWTASVATWSAVGGNGGTGGWSISCLSLGGGCTAGGYIKLVGQWENIGVPEGATVNYIDAAAFGLNNTSFDYKFTVANKVNQNAGWLGVYNSSDNLRTGAEMVPQVSSNSSTAWITKNATADTSTLGDKASDYMQIRILLDCTVSSSTIGTATTEIDNIVFIIDYTPGVIQDVSGSTGIIPFRRP